MRAGMWDDLCRYLRAAIIAVLYISKPTSIQLHTVPWSFSLAGGKAGTSLLAASVVRRYVHNSTVIIIYLYVDLRMSFS